MKMRLLVALFCMCSSTILLCAVDEASVASSEQSVVVVQTRETVEQMPAQKAVFDGIKNLEPELVRAAFAALIAHGQKVSALKVIESLEHVASWRPTIATIALIAYLYYGLGTACAESDFPRSFDRFFARCTGFVAVSIWAASIVDFQARLKRISQIVDVLVHCDAGLDFSGGLQKFILRVITLQRSVDPSDTVMTRLRLAVADMENRNVRPGYDQ